MSLSKKVKKLEKEYKYLLSDFEWLANKYNVERDSFDDTEDLTEREADFQVIKALKEKVATLEARVADVSDEADFWKELAQQTGAVMVVPDAEFDNLLDALAEPIEPDDGDQVFRPAKTYHFSKPDGGTLKWFAGDTDDAPVTYTGDWNLRTRVKSVKYDTTRDLLDAWERGEVEAVTE